MLQAPATRSTKGQWEASPPHRDKGQEQLSQSSDQRKADTKGKGQIHLQPKGSRGLP